MNIPNIPNMPNNNNNNNNNDDEIWETILSDIETIDNNIVAYIYNKYFVDVEKYKKIDTQTKANSLNTSTATATATANIDVINYYVNFEKFNKSVFGGIRVTRIDPLQIIMDTRETLAQASIDYHENINKINHTGRTDYGYIDDVRCYFIIKSGGKQHGIKRCDNKCANLKNAVEIKEHIKKINGNPDKIYENRCKQHLNIVKYDNNRNKIPFYNPLLDKWKLGLEYCERLDNGEELTAEEI